MKYERIPLIVDVVFAKDGTMKPRKIMYNEQIFDIKRIIRVKRYAPKTVPCIAPIEYTVQIENSEKKIYFEKETFMWFSVKEIQE